MRVQRLGLESDRGFAALSLDTTASAVAADAPEPDTVPYLIALHSDPQLSEKVKYKLVPGLVTIGSGPDCSIQLGGIYVLERHCTLTVEEVVALKPSVGGVRRGGGKCTPMCVSVLVVVVEVTKSVYGSNFMCDCVCMYVCVCAADWRDSDVSGWYVSLQAEPGASVYVNGVEVGSGGFASGPSGGRPTKVLLHTGDRVVIGVTHYVRYHNPNDTAAVAPLADWNAVNDVRGRRRFRVM